LIPVLQRLQEFGGSGHPVLFAHANGYPVGSYRRFIEHLLPACRVTGFHHRPMWSPEMPPVRLNWKRFSGDLIDTLEATQHEPVWMMGHSMGAVVSAMAAARRPELFRGLLLIDPVFLLRRRVAAQALTPRRTLDAMPMVRKTLTRPNRFASQQEAFDFHRGKRAFSRFTDEVLWDYILAGTKLNDEGELQLAYGREWEAAAYRSSPLVWGVLKKIRLPVLGLRGETSETLNPAAFERWGRVQPQADLRTCQGGHLLPLEYPAETAAEVLDFLAGQALAGGD
jgi:pimeloyl-ACP methyl ester carboxylesterase